MFSLASPRTSALSFDLKARTKIFCYQVGEPVAISFSSPVGDRARMGRTDPRRAGIVSAVDDLSACLRDELAVDGIDCGEILVEIKMLGFDIENDRVFGMIVDQGSVALVAFGDKVFAGSSPSVHSSRGSGSLHRHSAMA